MKRNKNAALIIFLSSILVIFLVVNALRHITVFIVYSSGLIPLIIIGILIFAILLLFFKRI